MKILESQRDYPSGFAALVSVLAVGAATLLMAYGASLLSLGDLDLGFTFQRGGATRATAEGCVEEVMGRIRRNASYIVTGGTLPLGGGSCTIDVINNPAPGVDKRIVVVAVLDNYQRSVSADLILTAEPGGRSIIEVAAWREPAN